MLEPGIEIGKFGPVAARIAARRLFDAAARNSGGALERAKDLICCLARTAAHPVFAEMLIGELAVLGIQRNSPRSSTYIAAELQARCALMRFIPELRVGPALQEGHA
jgi:hypothetical protein